MKVSIKRKELLTMLEFAKKYIEKKGTLPVLKNVYLQATTEWLRLRTTDMYKDFSVLLKDVKVSEEGAITANAEQLYKLIKRDKSYKLELSDNADGLVIEGGFTKILLHTIPAREYIAENDSPDCTTTCSTALLLDAIDKVGYVIKEKTFSPSLTGMLIKQIDNLVHFVGTDSFRLVRYRAKADLGNFECIVPVETLKAIALILKYAISIGATRLMIGVDDQRLSISISGGDQEIMITTLLVQGHYPDYDREEVIPTSYNGYLAVDRQELLQKLPQVMVLTTTHANFPVKFSVEDYHLTLSSGKTDNGELNTTLSCEKLGEVVDFSINGRYLLDFIKKSSSSQIKIEIIGGNKPLRITGMNDSSVEYIVRPLVVD